MENRFQTSFVPKRPVVSGPSTFVKHRNPPSLFLIISIIIFLLVGGSYGALYLYEGSLKVDNEEKKMKIEEAVKSFDPELSRELTVLKIRMDSGGKLLERHTSFSTLLSTLEKNIAQSIRLTDLSYALSFDQSSGQEEAVLTVKGESQTYGGLAFQSDTLLRNKIIQNPVFSDINVNDRGVIVFSMRADVDPSAILYKGLFAPVAPVVTPAPVVPASPATTTPASPQTSTSTATTTGPS